MTADEEGQAADGEILVFLDSYSCLGTDQLTHPIGQDPRRRPWCDDHADAAGRPVTLRPRQAASRSMAAAGGVPILSAASPDAGRQESLLGSPGNEEVDGRLVGPGAVDVPM